MGVEFLGGWIDNILMEFFTPDMVIRQSMIKNWTWWPVRYEDLVAIQSKLFLVNWG